MCGIAGIISFAHQQINEAKIERMSSLIEHRGPDDHGFFYDKNMAFAHRRLSILDLRTDGRQPMSWRGQYVIVFNGEIYNYLEIKNQLLKEGYEFTTGTDTEVILAAYDFWKTDCVNQFNGMWAFAIYDIPKRQIFCSRDRFGVKPFYYQQTASEFIFASEIKPLIDENPRLNTDIAIEYIVTGSTDYNSETFFDGIYSLTPSTNVVIDLAENTIDHQTYYDIKSNSKITELDERSATQKFAEYLERSINYRLRSDVRVGTCLSGGLDSSSVAAVASGLIKKQSEDKLIAITAISTEKSGDESGFAEQVVNHCDLEWVTTTPTYEDFTNNIEHIIKLQEEPFGSPSIFMQYFVMKAAKSSECKVMLDGQAGDETLLGYEKYYPSIFVFNLRNKGFFSAIKSFRDTLANNENTTIRMLISYTVVTFFPTLLKCRLRSMSRFVKKPLLSKTKMKHIDLQFKARFNIFQIQKNDVNHTNLPTLLKYEDRNSMYHSIEARLPFCDYKLVELNLNLSPDHKINGGWTKYILRKMATRFLPASVIWRKNKLGFNAPERTWLDLHHGELDKEIRESPMLKSICDFKKIDLTLRGMHIRQKWRLYNFAVWARIYNVRFEE